MKRERMMVLLMFFLCSVLVWGAGHSDVYDLPFMSEDYIGEMELVDDTVKKGSYSSWLTDDEEMETDSALVKIIEQQEALDSLDAMVMDSLNSVVQGPKNNMEDSTVDLDMSLDTIGPSEGFAEEKDSVVNFRLPKKAKIDTTNYATFRPNPTRSVWMGLIFPGLGQIYNRKYWKLPIVYGGVAGIAYAITWNSNTYSEYSRAYRDLLDSNPNTVSYEKLIPSNYPESQWVSYLETKQNVFRRNRDLSIIVGVIFYAITVVDAFVDASLADFNVSPDLSMKVKPKLDVQPNTMQPSIGAAMQLNF